MKLRALRMANVRRFDSNGMAIESIADGLNVFAAPNEAGKSTLFDGLQALLFEKFNSRASRVRSLKPYTGGRPRISADVEFEGGLYRIEKQFLGGAFVRVVDLNSGQEIAVADEAQAWIDGMMGAEGKYRGPTGLLWVRQGESSSLKEGAKERVEALASIIEEEVTTLTGGARVRRVLERCAEELGEMVTGKGKPKANSGCEQAVKRVAQLEGRKSELQQELDTARGTVKERHDKQRQFAELTDPKKEACEEDELNVAQQAKEAAEKYHDRVEKTKKERDLARLGEEAAQSERDTFSENCEAARERQLELKEYRKQRRERQQALAAATAAQEQRHAALEEAEKAFQSARKLLDAARIAHEARQAKAQHDELVENLAAAEAADKEAKTNRAAAKAQGVDQDDIDQLNGLLLEVDKANATLDSVSTQLQVQYEPGYAKRIKMGSAVLDDKVEVRIDNAAILTIDEVGKLAITPASADGGDEARRRLHNTRNVLADRLKQLNCRDIEQARALRDSAAQLIKQAERAEAIVAIRAPGGIEALRIEVAQLKEKLDASVKEEVIDVSEAEKAFEAAGTKERNTRSEWEAARRTTEAKSSQRKQLKGQIRTAKQACERALSRTSLPPAKWPDHKKKLDAEFRKKNLKANECQNALEVLLIQPMDQAAAAANLKRLNQARENRLKEIGDLKTDLAVLSERIDSAAKEGIEEAFSEVSGQLETALAHVARYRAKITALQRLLTAVEDQAAELKDRYLQPVYQELAPLLSLLYEDAQLDFDGEKLIPEQLTRAGVSENIDALSGGTREQVAILTRLAFARLFAKSGRIMPIILDDALIYSDDDRIEKMFTALHLRASDLQILVFSCRQRAFRGLGGTVLRMQPWKSDTKEAGS